LLLPQRPLSNIESKAALERAMHVEQNTNIVEVRLMRPRYSSPKVLNPTVGILAKMLP